MTIAVVLTLALAPTAAPAAAPPAPDVRAAVTKGLDWLAGRQRADGSWSGPQDAQPTVITATAGLAFLMHGSTPAEGPYAANIRKAIDWFERTTQPGGPLASRELGEQGDFVRGHAAAVLFLACVYECDTDAARRARVKKLLDAAIALLVECQTERGGFGLVRAADGRGYADAYNTAAVLQALAASRQAGIAVPDRLIRRAVAYLTACTGPDGTVVMHAPAPGTSIMPGWGYNYLAAASATATLATGEPRPGTYDTWIGSAAAANLSGTPEGTYSLLVHWHVARLAFTLGDTGHPPRASTERDRNPFRWSVYRIKLFKAVVGAQQKDGSWPDLTFGAEFATAVALAILQLDNDYLPAFSR